MMDDGMLSQDEIDALLSVTDDNDDQDDGEEKQAEQAPTEILVSDYLSSIEEDTIGEIGNISFGSSATTLSTLLNQKVEITTPKVSILRKQDLNKELPEEHVKVQVNYVEGFAGENLFVIDSKDARIISDIMLGGDGTNPDEELTEIHLSAVQEAMNQMMGTAATSMSTIFNKLVNISPPNTELITIDSPEAAEVIEDLDDEIFVQVSFQLKVGDLIDSHIMQLIPFPFANNLVAELLNGGAEEAQSEEPEVESVPARPTEPVASRTESDPIEEKTQYIGSQVSQGNAEIQQASFSNFDQIDLSQNEHRNLDMLLDVSLNVTVELGRTKRPIKDILDLTSGSIIELDKLAGEPVDILVNQKLIAQGEVVVIDENFGVRVTEIISKTARLMNLN